MNKEFRRMMQLAGLAEMKINNPGDLSNLTNLKRVLDKIPNEKYFPIIKDDEEYYIPYDDTQWDDIASNIVDDLYDPIFDDYIKGKPGIEEDNYWDWIDNEREKNDDEQGPLERLVIDKIWDILNDYKNQQKNLDEIKVNDAGKLPNDLDGLLNILSNYVDGSEIYKNNFRDWEEALFSTYDDWVNIYGPDDSRVAAVKLSPQEWDKLHDEIEHNYDFNYFVRNFRVGDEEETRHEDDIDQDLEYFQDKYNVNKYVALVMKKIVDEHLAPYM
jgi:hypothetical protein